MLPEVMLRRREYLRHELRIVDEDDGVATITVQRCAGGIGIPQDDQMIVARFGTVPDGSQWRPTTCTANPGESRANVMQIPAE